MVQPNRRRDRSRGRGVPGGRGPRVMPPIENPSNSVLEPAAWILRDEDNVNSNDSIQHRNVVYESYFPPSNDVDVTTTADDSNYY